MTDSVLNCNPGITRMSPKTYLYESAEYINICTATKSSSGNSTIAGIELPVSSLSSPPRFINQQNLYIRNALIREGLVRGIRNLQSLSFPGHPAPNLHIIETTNEVNTMRRHNTRYGMGGGGSALYGLGFVGAIIYYVSTATSFWMGVLGVLKAIVWPAFLVYVLLKSSGM
jgi:hypothetical protein